MRTIPGVMFAAAMLLAAPPVRADEPCGAAKAAGVVANITGTADIRRAGSDNWQSAKVGDSLATGDSIRTAAASKAQITYCDGARVRLDANTQLKVTSVAGRTRLDVDKGRTWSATKDQKGLELKTPSALDAIRR